MRADHHHQRMPVGRALRHLVGPDQAVRAGLVLDDHRLSEGRRELLADEPGHRVGDTAGRVGHDDADRPRRVGLRQGVARTTRRRQGGRQAKGEATPRLCRVGHGGSSSGPARAAACGPPYKSGRPARQAAPVNGALTMNPAKTAQGCVTESGGS
jgi:hypothetical protein